MNIHCLYDALVDPKALKEHPKNRNIHPKEQIDRLIQILEYQGFRYAIKISKQSGFITSGHGRRLAAMKMKIKEVPVVYQDYESEDQEYADIVADNAIAAWAELDLSNINMDIADLGPDFDINLLGIKNFEIEIADKFQGDPDEVPDVPKEPKSVLGDLYELGNHRLLCGDSTSIDAVEKLMNGDKADMVFTDPPYNTGMSSKKNNGSTWLNHMFDDDYTTEEWENLLASLASSYWIASKDTSAHYVCLNWKRSHELVPIYIKQGFNYSNLIIWDKVVHGLGSDYKYTHEFIHVFKKGKPELNTHQGEAEYKDVWSIQRKMGKDNDHATKKPIELIDRGIRHASKQNDLVLDLFGGSGSTLIACEKTKRKCFMMELDPHYIDVIVSRYVKFTGNNKIKLNGKDIEWSQSGQ